MSDLLQRAQQVRLAIFDVDGVLTDGRLYFLADGSEFKTFNTLDGHGIKMLMRSGVRTGQPRAQPKDGLIAEDHCRGGSEEVVRGIMHQDRTPSGRRTTPPVSRARAWVSASASLPPSGAPPVA